MANHRMKIHPEPFEALLSGAMSSEVRALDGRNFQVSDTVSLIEVGDEAPHKPTGRTMERVITHVQTGYGLPAYMCVLSYGESGRIAELERELAAIKSSGWRNHSVNYARAENCPQTLETAQAAWDRDQELIEEQRQQLAKDSQAINSLRQKLEACRKDAERYRWLRSDESNGKVDLCVTKAYWDENCRYVVLVNEGADWAIDAAMKEVANNATP